MRRSFKALPFFSCPLCFFPYSLGSSDSLLFQCLMSFLLFPYGKAGKSSTFHIAILNGTCSLRSAKTAKRSGSRVLLN